MSSIPQVAFINSPSSPPIPIQNTPRNNHPILDRDDLLSSMTLVAKTANPIFSSVPDSLYVNDLKSIDVQVVKSNLSITPTESVNYSGKIPESDQPMIAAGEAVTEVPDATERELLERKNGKCWECIGREKGKEGYIYRFRFMNDLNNEFPSLEKLPKMLREDINEHIDKETLYLLGYSYSKSDENGIKVHFFTAPDTKELLCRWNELRSHPANIKMPELKIKSVDGISSDLEFIRTFCSPEFDRVSAEGGQFLHDQHYHILSLIKLLLSAQRERELMPLVTTFEEEMSRIKQLVNERLEDILYLTALSLDNDSVIKPDDRVLYRECSEQLVTSLGALVDAIFTLFDDVYELRHTKQFDIFDLDLVLDDGEDWFRYFYGENGKYKDSYNINLESAWEELTAKAEMYRKKQIKIDRRCSNNTICSSSPQNHTKNPL